MNPYLEGVGIAMLTTSGSLALYALSTDYVCRRREKRHQLQLWRAFSVGYRRGTEEYLGGGEFPAPAAKFTPFDPLAAKRDRGATLTANTLVASRIGRIEGWTAAMLQAPISSSSAPFADELVDGLISAAADELMEWSHEEHERRAA